MKPSSEALAGDEYLKPSTALLPLANRGFMFWESVVLKAFSAMQRGHLELRLPGGEVRHLGVQGTSPSAKLHILDSAFYRKCVFYGDVGFGEGYVEGLWDSADPTAVIEWVIHNLESAPGLSGSRARNPLLNLLQWMNRLTHNRRRNTPSNSRANIAAHYDLGNEFYRLFLDRTMTYSAAVFTSPDQPLEEAQTEKYERLCQKLRLQPGEKVLEIGCGWGGFAEHAARHHGVHVTAVTISAEQFHYARNRIREAGLETKAQILLQDYRRLQGSFDKIVSIEMLEAVGDAYLETYFEQCHRLLRPNGLLALQMITCPDSRYESFRKGVDWIQKHIFPGSLLLSLNRVGEAMVKTGSLTLLDLEDYGIHYAMTLRRWKAGFLEQLPQAQALGYSREFCRQWHYYLCYCEAAFMQRNISVVHAVYTRPNNSTLCRL